jgi:NHS family xanthosine MFS transporter
MVWRILWIISGIVIDKFFTQGGVRDWHNIWLVCRFILIIAIAFAVLFKHKHYAEDVASEPLT